MTNAIASTTASREAGFVKWAEKPARGHNAVGVDGISDAVSLIAAARQPWARGRNAVGVGKEWVRVRRVGLEAPDKWGGRTSEFMASYGHEEEERDGLQIEN